MTHPAKLLLPLTALIALAACDAPDPDDYGGGVQGEAIAKCITKTERADSSVTRAQAGEMCTCLTDKVMASAKSAMSGGSINKASMERAFVGCATKAGIEITD
ncbi:MAG: hypothetical protein AAF559_09825 [Pseudomonadota bacterium]